MKKQIVASLLALSMIAGCGAAGSGVSNANNSNNSNNSNTNQNTESHRTISARNVTADAPEIEINAENGELSSEQISALSGSAFEMLQQIASSEEAGSNILISPTSMMIAFGMLENGANGETLSQIEKTFGSIPVSEMNPIMYRMAQRFNEAEDVNWNVANSIWFKDDGKVEVVPDFASAVKNYYNADIWMAPFDQSTLEDINGWVNDQTYGMIPGILDNIPEDARMYLINAMAFEGEWMNEYEDNDIIENYEFRNYDGSVSKVTMLYSLEDRYVELGNGVGFIRPYKGGEYSFVGILPEEGTSVEEYIRSLASDGTDFAEAVRNAKGYSSDIIVRMPEFSNEYEVEMSHILMDMGMQAPFDYSAADFNGIMRAADGSESNAFINAVLHKTFIEVNREGTRAAAVTSIELDCAGCEPISEPPMIITLDRPFVYAVVDNATGLPVFLGCVNSL